jgi:hypothetical protein
MKILKSLSVLLLVSTVFVACKKDNDEVAPPPPSTSGFVGKWVGKYGFDAEDPAYFFSLNIKTGGVIQELNTSGVAKGQGTYTIEGNTLKGTYKMLFSPFNEYSVSGVLNASTGKFEGSWGYDKNGTDGGKMSLSKQ